MSAQDLNNADGMNGGSGKDWSEDPRLTAYAFGELEDSDSQEMQELCATEPGAQAYVDEMRALGGELEAQFGSEVELALSGEQRAAIEAQMDVPAQAPKRGRLLHMSRYALVGSAAAVLVAGVFVIKQGESEQYPAMLNEAIARLEGRSETLKRSFSPPASDQVQDFESSSGRAPLKALQGLGYMGDDGPSASAGGSSSVAPATRGELAQRRQQKEQYGKRLSHSDWLPAGESPASKGQRDDESLQRLTELGYSGGIDFDGGVPGVASETYRGPGDSAPAPSAKASELRALGYAGGPSSPPPGAPSSPGSDYPKRSKDKSRKELKALRGLGYSGDTEFYDGPFDADDRSQDTSGETYKHVTENPFKLVAAEPLSTFSVDVDTASYANARDLLNRGSIPPAAAVRVEEFINYFRYDYGAPEGSDPFSVNVEVGSAPWAPQHRLMRVGLQAKETLPEDRKSSNLVFLLDVSGSMNSADKLPLLQSALHMLVQELDERDSVAIVVYAGASGLLLPATHCNSSAAIHAAIDSLRSGGSTNGGEGIELAYKVAASHFIPGGINRVILGTDGDFNVGVSDEGGLERLIAEKAKTGVFLSVLGFGRGNLQDVTMETLADKGNGNYSYIDSVLEARKVLVQELGSTLEVVAKDVKIQVEFNPSMVQGYRLIGYENRMLAAQDFNDDKKDAGEIGAGHRVTALYEIVPVGVPMELPPVDGLRYQTPKAPTGAAASGELCMVKLRYKRPEGSTSILIERPVLDSRADFQELSANTRWATAVASFALLLKNSSTIRETSAVDIMRWATESVVEDSDGYCRQFIYLVGRYEELKGR